MEHVEDIWIEVLREEQRLQRRAVPLNLLGEDIESFFGLQPITRVNWDLLDLFWETQMPSDNLTTGTSPFPKHLLDLKKGPEKFDFGVSISWPTIETHWQGKVKSVA